jgi:hypothetical protein
LEAVAFTRCSPGSSGIGSVSEVVSGRPSIATEGEAPSGRTVSLNFGMRGTSAPRSFAASAFAVRCCQGDFAVISQPEASS